MEISSQTVDTATSVLVGWFSLYSYYSGNILHFLIIFPTDILPGQIEGMNLRSHHTEKKITKNGSNPCLLYPKQKKKERERYKLPMLGLATVLI